MQPGSPDGASRPAIDPLEQRIRALYGALARRDLADLALQLTGEVVWRESPSRLGDEILRGRVQVVDHLARLVSRSRGSYQLTILDLYAASEGRYVVRELEHGWRLGRRLVHEACLRIDVGSDGITYLERFDPTPVAIPLSPF